MFNCRACSSLPFASFFGVPENVSVTDPNSNDTELALKTKMNRKNKKDESSGHPNATTNQTSDSETRNRFTCRNDKEIKQLCDAWESYLHLRAKEYWHAPGSLRAILATLAKGIDKDDDPVLSEECVLWHGDISEEGYYPIICIKNEDGKDTITYVTRLLVFLYADEDSFREMQKKSNVSFPTACDKTRCISLTHICMD